MTRLVGDRDNGVRNGCDATIFFGRRACFCQTFHPEVRRAEPDSCRKKQRKNSFAHNIEKQSHFLQ